jgi:hypothetical protein
VILGSGLLVVLLGWQHGLNPLLTRWQAARQTIAQVEAQQSSLLSDALQRRTQQRRLTSVFGKAAATPAPPVKPTRASLVKQVKDLVDSAGLESKDVRAQPLRPLAEWSGRATLGLTLEATGEPEQLAEMLGELRQSDTLLMIDRLDVTGEGKRGEDLDLSLTLTTLVRIPQEASPGP